MRASIVAALILLLASLLLLASCSGYSGEKSEAPKETAEKTTEKSATPQTARVPTLEGEVKAGRTAGTVVLVNSLGQRVEVEVEIADEPEEHQKGLRGHEPAENAGMLFVFNRVGRPNFWTKYTPIPVSIAFINAQGYIVDIQDRQSYDVTVVPPAAPIQYALMVNQGFFEKHGVEVGNCLYSPACQPTA